MSRCSQGHYILIHTDGVQNMSPQHVPLRDKDYFELNSTKAPKTRGLLFSSPLTVLEGLRWRAWSRKRAVTRHNISECGWGVVGWGEPSKACLFQVLAVAHCHIANVFTKHLFSPSSCELSYFLLKPQTQTPFSLAQDGI